jgi:hypothetical protein
MKILKTNSWMILCAVALLLAGQAAWAQTANVPARVVEAVDDTRTVTLQGNVHPLARAANDQGALPDSQPMTRMLLLLQRSDAQEASLRQLMDAQQTKGSGSYHTWLTPELFGKQYGPADTDVQAVTDWLTRQGFQVARVAAGRTVIEFSGNVGQVRNAFHTQIHKYVVKGEEHFANASDPAIPEALAPVVKGVVALHNFPIHAQHRRVGSFQRNLATGDVKPLFTYTDLNGTFYGVGPADFAKIYNIPAGADGTGQSIAIVGQSNINIQDVRDFRSMFGLPANDPKIIVNGPDPGLQLASGDEEESDLDVEWAGAVAPAANIVFVTSQSTQSSLTQVVGGVDLSALYIIDNNLAPVMSESYGECEPFILTAGNAFYNALWQQAAAEGITVVVAAGDSGSAGCDSSFTENAATNGLAVSGTASTPYNVAVGGTDFDQLNNLSNYWSPTNNATTQLSALGYIAEVPWDDSTCAANFPTCTTVDSSGADLSAGAGGPSNCVSATSDNSGNITCNTGSGAFPNLGYPKPAFQNGVTPSDSLRDLPDISLFAGDGINSSFYIICESDANPNNAPCDSSTSPTSGTHNFTGVGGTSGGTPSFAAIIALVNQQTGGRQGNANYVLYALAATKETYSTCKSSLFTNPTTETIPATCVFFDITTGNNSIACVAGSPNCSNPGSGYGLIISGVSADHGSPAFQSETGYDLATGLGSINVANLLTNWSTAVRTPTTTTLGAPSPATLTSGQSFSIPITVTPAGAAGNVSLTALASNGSTILGSVAANTAGPFTLSGGSVTVSTNLLPPGTAYIEGYYGGDVTHGASTSTPPLALAVSGANQTSKTALNFVTFDANNNPILNTSGNVSYGSSYIVQIAVTNSSGTSCLTGGTATTPATPCPTGTVALTDNNNALDDWPIAGTLNATNIAKLNNQSIAEDQPIQLPGGSHSLVAQFTSGDTNFQGSTSNTLSVTITKATTQTLVGGPSPVTSGATVTLTAQVQTNSNGAGPTGTVSFTNGSASLGSANCVPTAYSVSTGTPAYCTATLSTAISGLYPPPVGGPKGPGLPVMPVIMALVGLLLFALGFRWMPEGRRRAYAYAGLVAFALLVVGIAGCGGGSSSGGGGGTTRTITASYPGDTNYSSSSGTVQITVQ